MPFGQRYSNAMKAPLCFGIAAILATAACTSSLEEVGASDDAVSTLTRAPDIEVAASRTWAGEDIQIFTDGAQLSIAGGLEIVADPTATKVSAIAQLSAFYTPGVTTPSADRGTLSVELVAGRLRVRCTRAPAIGEGGCNHVRVVVPAGTAAQPLVLRAQSFSNVAPTSFAGASAFLGELTIHASGDIHAVVPATKGASIELASTGHDVTAVLPADFASNHVLLRGDSDQIDTSDFPDVTSGAPRGAIGTGLRFLLADSTTYAGTTGRVVLQKQ